MLLFLIHGNASQGLLFSSSSSGNGVCSAFLPTCTFKSCLQTNRFPSSRFPRSETNRRFSAESLPPPAFCQSALHPQLPHLARLPHSLFLSRRGMVCLSAPAPLPRAFSLVMRNIRGVVFCFFSAATFRNNKRLPSV